MQAIIAFYTMLWILARHHLKKNTGRLTYRVIYLNVVFLRPRQLAILSTH